MDHGDYESQLDVLSSTAQSRSCGCSEDGRNLVVCIDGAMNELGEKNTNIMELYGLVPKGEEDRQRIYFNSGVGSYAGPSRRSLVEVMRQKAEYAFAGHSRRIVLGAYRWLSETYKDGDRIFLFGFSRGAYQVRVLSAMIDKVGLIDRGNEEQIPFAYKWYIRETSSPSIPGEKRNVISRIIKSFSGSPPPKSLPNGIHSAERFKEVFSRTIKVHFVGAWDTVPLVGIFRKRKLLPGTTDGMKHVCYFRHALALDERRVKFLPEYAYGNEGPLQVTTKWQGFNDTKEVWFAGTHADVGGHVDQESFDSSRPALKWMYTEALAGGLRLHLFKRKAKLRDDRDRDIKVHRSLTGFWWLFEYLPLRRLTYITTEDGKTTGTTRRLHRGGARVIQKGQKVHPSVWLSEDLANSYIPCAHIHASDGKLSEVELWRKMDFWSKLKEQEQEKFEADGTVSNPWKEGDIDELVSTVVEQYADSKAVIPSDERQHNQLAAMRSYATSAKGWRVLSRELLQLLDRHDVVQADILCTILDILTKSGDARSKILLGPYRAIRPQILRHLKGADDAQYRIAQRFLAEFTDLAVLMAAIIGLVGHAKPISSVAFSFDGRRIVSGSYDRTVRTWDAGTGQPVGRLLEGHSDWVRSVSLRHDGKYVASGSDDHTIMIWNLKTGQVVVGPLEGHAGFVLSVAFSPDGKHIVSGSSDFTIRIWDAEGGHLLGEPLTGHNDWVLSVAFSPDGKQIASGSSDNTLRVWDVEVRKLMWTSYKGHTDAVTSVAFSPDSQSVVSGSSDYNIQMWDAGTGDNIGQPFRGHKGRVTSLAFSQEGNRIVSGSADETIRIWDVDTGLTVGKPYEGHSGPVTSVAFSPDGERILSGSEDNTIRIWDAIQEPL
ncbi:WD40 repeat-like protein [Peniophora sp. CONT]|nr:WD40 repeat-like protein [Peniophora sp. CONT]